MHVLAVDLSDVHVGLDVLIVALVGTSVPGLGSSPWMTSRIGLTSRHLAAKCCRERLPSLMEHVVPMIARSPSGPGEAGLASPFSDPPEQSDIRPESARHSCRSCAAMPGGSNDAHDRQGSSTPCSSQPVPSMISSARRPKEAILVEVADNEIADLERVSGGQSSMWSCHKRWS